MKCLVFVAERTLAAPKNCVGLQYVKELIKFYLNTWFNFAINLRNRGGEIQIFL